MVTLDYFPLLTWLSQSRSTPPPVTTSFKGKTVLMTGASGAIVSTAARILLDLDVTALIFAVPDIPEGQEGYATLVKLVGEAAIPRVTVWHLDLVSFSSVNAFAARAAKLERLDVVLMGAAIIVTDRRVSSDGWEWTLQVNHISCALLSILLLPVLQESARKHGTTGVLSAVSSMSVRTSAIAMPTPKDGETLLRAVSEVRGYGAQRQQYGLTKLLCLYFLRELAARWKSADVIVHACDFGVSRGTTGIATVNWEAKLFSSVFGRPAEMCARVVANSCLPLEGTHGALLLDYEKFEYPRFMGTANGKETQARLWKETMDLISEVSPESKELRSALEAGSFQG